MSHLNDVLKYANLHVYIFPCHFITESGTCSCGNPSCKSPGKHPIRELVQNGHLDASNDPEQIKKWWTDAPLANPGLSLAPSSLVVIDIDPRNGGDQTFDELEVKRGKITSDVEQLTGGGGRHIVYVADKDARYPGKLGAGVDVKHQGYIMVWPSNHVLGHYEWESESDLMEGYIPSAAPAWLALPKGDEFNVNIQPAAPGMGLAALLDTEVQELKAALSYLSNQERDDWLKVGMAIHSLDSGQAGFALWEDWSASCDKFDPQDQARVWFSFHNKADQLNKGSIFHWAQEQGWVNPMKTVVSDENRAKGQKIAQLKLAVNNTHINESVLLPPKEERPLVFPTHGLAEIQSIIGMSGYVNYPDASMSAAVLFACLAASRRYVSDSGESSHVYFGVSAVSVGMVRYTVNAIQTLLSDAGMRHLYSSSRKSTVHGIYNQLAKSGAYLYCVEDFGKMLQQSKKQFGNGSMEHAIDTMGSIYSKSTIQVDPDDTPSRKSVSDQFIVYQPAMSLLGLVSHDQLTVLTRKSEVGSGMTVNMLMTICDEDQAVNQFRPHVPKCPEWLLQQLMAMRGLNPEDRQTNGIFDANAERGDLKAEPIVITIPDTHHYDGQIMALSDNRSLIPVLHGARITMRRIALGLSAWDNPANPVITPEIMAFSASFVIRHTERFIDSFKRLEVDEEGRSSIYLMVLDVIIDAKENGLTKSGIRDKCHKFRVMEDDARDKLLDQLESDNEIVLLKNGRRKIYVSTRFVKPEALKDDTWGISA